MAVSIGKSLAGSIQLFDGNGTPPEGSVPTFNSSGGINTASLVRVLPITSLRMRDGTAPTATTLATGWAISGTTVGAALSVISAGVQNNTLTPSGFFEFQVPTSFQSGGTLAISINAQYVANSGTNITATMLPRAFVMANGGTISGSNLVSAGAQTLTASAAAYSWTLGTTGVAAGGRLILGLEGTVIEAGNTGASRIQVNSVSVTA